MDYYCVILFTSQNHFQQSHLHLQSGRHGQRLHPHWFTEAISSGCGLDTRTRPSWVPLISSSLPALLQLWQSSLALSVCCSWQDLIGLEEGEGKQLLMVFSGLLVANKHTSPRESKLTLGAGRITLLLSLLVHTSHLSQTLLTVITTPVTLFPDSSGLLKQRNGLKFLPWKWSHGQRVDCKNTCIRGPEETWK